MKTIIIKGVEFTIVNDLKHLDKNGLITFKRKQGGYRGYSYILYTNKNGEAFYIDCRTSHVHITVDFLCVSTAHGDSFRLLEDCNIFVSTCKNMSSIYRINKPII